ncbi:type III pantothenate kinase [bacterium]|nr:type III pantothenate kinase [bacterium]
MLLVCDIGNSNIVFGIYDGSTLVASWRLTSRLNATVDEYLVMTGTLLQRQAGTARISDAIISSVVPPLLPKLRSVIRELTGAEPLVVGPGVRTGLDIQYEDPRQVGADRIVNAVAAIERHGPPLIAVDFGTATTFDVVLEPNVYLGGIIFPGIHISLDSLVSRTAKLPKVELSPVERIVGRNTSESIRSGILNGTGAMVDELVDRICEEQQIEPTVLATGGFAELVREYSRSIQFVETDLTLFGLRLIWERNR